MTQKEQARGKEGKDVKMVLGVLPGPSADLRGRRSRSKESGYVDLLKSGVPLGLKVDRWSR
jgi:hypothetical protein